MSVIEHRDTPDDEQRGAIAKAGWRDAVWHERDDGLRAFVRLSEANERLAEVVKDARELARLALIRRDTADDVRLRTLARKYALPSATGGQ